MSSRIDQLLRGKEAPSVERPVVKYAKDHGWLVVKLSFLGIRGAPDRLFMGKHGDIIFIEFKRPGRRVPAYQSRIHRMLRKRGFNVYVVFEKEEGINILNNHVA